MRAPAASQSRPGPAWPHMAAAGAAAVWNVKHVFALCCEERSEDALLSLEGRAGHVCLPHGAEMFMPCAVCGSWAVWGGLVVTMAHSTAVTPRLPRSLHCVPQYI